MKKPEMRIKAEFKGECVILKEHIGNYYNALNICTQEEIWIKDDSKLLILADEASK